MRTVILRGFKDPEAVEYMSPNHLVVLEERRGRMTEVEITKDTRALTQTGHREFSISSVDDENKGFEGLAYDPSLEKWYIAKEKNPIRLFEVTGVFPVSTSVDVDIHNDPGRDQRFPVGDLSGLAYDSKSGHLLVLSDESKSVLEVDKKEAVVGSLQLRSGHHGLKSDIPQPEGIAIDSSGAIYIMSEPNLFYRFRLQASG
jgi:uncharacterized protein YjiK